MTCEPKNCARLTCPCQQIRENFCLFSNWQKPAACLQICICCAAPTHYTERSPDPVLRFYFENLQHRWICILNFIICMTKPQDEIHKLYIETNYKQEYFLQHFRFQYELKNCHVQTGFILLYCRNEKEINCKMQ